jgi:hypothetical protein
MRSAIPAIGLMVRDGAMRLLTMRDEDVAANKILILRRPPEAAVSKDGCKGATRPASFFRLAQAGVDLV